MAAAGTAAGGQRIRCRVVACREVLNGDHAWSFYLVNDGGGTIDAATLARVDASWGDRGHGQATGVHVVGLAPGEHARVWRDDGELRLNLAVRVRAGGREARLLFEFPRL